MQALEVEGGGIASPAQDASRAVDDAVPRDATALDEHARLLAVRGVGEEHSCMGTGSRSPRQWVNK